MRNDLNEIENGTISRKEGTTYEIFSKQEPVKIDKVVPPVKKNEEKKEGE